MAKTSYPSPAELEAYVVSTGLVSSDDVGDVDFQSAAEAAVREWEEQTGWLPFLAAAANTSRRYDPPGPNGGARCQVPGARGGASRLWLGAGIVSSTTPGIVTGYSPTDAGTTLTVEDDFWMGPENADQTGKPWQWIELSSALYGGPRSVRVTGRFGYSATLGDDVWSAVRMMGALEVAPEIEGLVSGGMVAWKEADVEEKYGDDPLATWVSRWEAKVRQVVMRYKRIVL